MKRKLAVLCGSDSDFSQIASGLAILDVAEIRGEAEVVSVTVCSAHRNPMELREFLSRVALFGIDVVIMCAGKLAALFGDCDAISRNELWNTRTHFIAVPLRGKTEDACMAAYLSAKEVPNAQFIFHEEFWENPEIAFSYAVSEEFPEIVLEDQKPSQSLSLREACYKGRRRYPERADYSALINQLEEGGLIHMYTGKTRETFVNPEYTDILLILATDRSSIFDIVLNATIPNKGAVLTAMTVHWLKNVFSEIPNHLLAYGAGILEYLPNGIGECVSMGYLMKNMIAVQRTRVLKVEAIVRGCLTGSGWKDYQRTGSVCGIVLPPGLVDGSEIDVIFTPSTKADYGQHDENISYDRAERIVGADAAKYIRDTATQLYMMGKDYLRKAGIILADTKFEFGLDGKGQMLLIDEILTPDSSRFWPEEGWRQALLDGRTPPSFDKQPLRIAGEVGGIKTINPEWVPSEELIAETRRNYEHMVRLATGKSLQQFWVDKMGIISEQFR